ncbi:MAG: hypothetical protein ACI8ZO_000589 [Flavobacteriales bacterium]
MILINQLPAIGQEILRQDGYYDTGYPNFFFVVVLDEKNEIVFDSKILDFDCGDEFCDAELMGSLSKETTDKGFEFMLYRIEEKIEVVWTGKEIKTRYNTLYSK